MRIYADGVQDERIVPEEKQIHESDLTPQEKRRMELARFKEMTPKEKWGFFWDYYKWTLVAVLVVALLAYEGVQMHHRLSQIQLLGIAVVDVSVNSGEAVQDLQKDLALFMGTGDPHEVVDIDTSVYSGESPEAVTKLAVLMAAGVTDLAILDADNYQKYLEASAFVPWEDLLGDSYEDYADLFDEEGRLVLNRCERWQSYGISEQDTVYCGVLHSSEHKENCVEFLRFFTLGQEELEAVLSEKQAGKTAEAGEAGEAEKKD